MNVTSLKQKSANFTKTATSALNWVSNSANTELLGSSQNSLTVSLRRIVRRAEKLTRAVDRNTSVSVFGPSQAGKSFLVSVLARPEASPLVANYAGEGNQLDYIRDINPEGEGESTGLVSRFTMQGSQTPAGYPVHLDILSESDVLKILLNSFFLDGDQSEDPPTAKEMSTHIETYRNRMQQNVAGLSAEDIWEMEEYVEKRFGKTAYASALKGLWQAASEICPKLDRQDRGEFFKIVWGNHGQISSFYTLLASTLDTIGHAKIVYAPISSLVPKDDSIIDVKTLHKIFNEGKDNIIQIQTNSGSTVNIDKPLLCALTAEMEVPMFELPQDFLGYTDLLDFPGARNRFAKPLDVQLNSGENALSEMLLRGKVSYLFDRYVSDQEITSMLLCIPNSNMETLDLPSLVDGWLKDTMGDSPEKRENKDNILFFVMTKFDMHLSDSAASSGKTTRFDRRIESSLLEKFGRGRDQWVETWSRHSPFQNCFWLRNPNYFVEAIYNYDKVHSRETMREEKKESVEELREGYLQSEMVSRYFSNPSRAWDAALSPNDGGVSLLVEEIEKVCRPETKSQQISAQLRNLSDTVKSLLSPYYISDDLDELLDKKREDVDDLIENSLTALLEDGLFGEFISSISVSEDAVRQAISEVPEDVQFNTYNKHSMSTAAKEKKRWVRRKPSSQSEGEQENTDVSENAESSTNSKMMTREEYFASRSLEVWANQLLLFRDNEKYMNKNYAAFIAAELQKGITRSALRNTIQSRLIEIGFSMTLENQLPEASMVCIQEINSFVGRLGIDDLPQEKRPEIEQEDGTMVRAFEERVEVNFIDDLPSPPVNTAETYWKNWAHCFDHLVKENVLDGKGESSEENKILGELIESLTRDIV